VRVKVRAFASGVRALWHSASAVLASASTFEGLMNTAKLGVSPAITAELVSHEVTTRTSAACQLLGHRLVKAQMFVFRPTTQLILLVRFRRWQSMNARELHEEVELVHSNTVMSMQKLLPRKAVFQVSVAPAPLDFHAQESVLLLSEGCAYRVVTLDEAWNDTG
jgi:hypothetical protein